MIDRIFLWRKPICQRKNRTIGVLTSGGDVPGMNVAICGCKNRYQ